MATTWDSSTSIGFWGIKSDPQRISRPVPAGKPTDWDDSEPRVSTVHQGRLLDLAKWVSRAAWFSRD